MPSQITVTSVTGPAKTITAQVIPNVGRLVFNFAPKSTLEVENDKGIKQFDIAATTTATITIAAGIGTVVVSQ